MGLQLKKTDESYTPEETPVGDEEDTEDDEEPTLDDIIDAFARP